MKKILLILLITSSNLIFASEPLNKEEEVIGLLKLNGFADPCKDCIKIIASLDTNNYSDCYITSYNKYHPDRISTVDTTGLDHVMATMTVRKPE